MLQIFGKSVSINRFMVNGNFLVNGDVVVCFRHNHDFIERIVFVCVEVSYRRLYVSDSFHYDIIFNVWLFVISRLCQMQTDVQTFMEKWEIRKRIQCIQYTELYKVVKL